MAEPVQVEFGAKIDKLVSAVEESKKQLQSIQGTVGGLAQGFDTLRDRIIEAFSFEGALKFAEMMGQLGLSLERAQSQLGGTMESIVQLGGMAQLSGMSLEGMTMAMERMSLGVMRSTRDAMSPAADALRVLGLNAKSFLSLDFEGRINALHDAVSKFNPSLNLTNALMQAGGRGVAQLLPFLMKNKEEWDHLTDAVKQARDGVAANSERMAQGHVQTTLLALSTQSLSAVVYGQLSPAINGLIGFMARWVQSIRDSIKDGGTFSHLMDGLAFAVRLAASAFVGLVAGVTAFGLAVAAVVNLSVGNLDEIQKKAEQTAKEFERIGTDMKKALTDIWSAPLPITVSKGGLDARAVNEGLQKAMTDRLKIIENEYRLEVDKIKELYGDFILTEGLKTAALEKALRDRYNAEVAAGENQKVALSKFNLDFQKIMRDQTKAYEKAWNDAFSALQGAFNSQLRGLLAGTTRFKDAFKAILGDMIIWFIQEIEKMAFKWIAHELALTTATETGVAARKAAEATGEATALPAKIARFTSDITADAAMVFGGIFANLSPLLGPAAAGPAAAGQATVLAELANVPKFDVGTNYVARTGLAMIHQGEQIRPAQGTGAFTGGGGDTMNIHISAVDARSFVSLLNSNQAAFTDLIKRAVRDRAMAGI